ncbi:MAG: phosphatidylserine decarboxylase, partial [Verrucomicrobiales bacterium]
MQPVQFYNRHREQLETEEIYGEGFLKWAYGNPLGKAALHSFVKRPFFSAWYGRRMSDPKSRAKIRPFIENYQLNPSEFAKSPGEFTSFNDFFARELAPGARPLTESPLVFPA